MEEELKRTLNEYFHASGERHGVEVAYLFGSVAKGTAGLHSDVDVAVLFSIGLSKEDRFEHQLALADELAPRLDREVDVIDLAAAPLVLQHQVLARGVLLFERDAKLRTSFEVASRWAYLDHRRIRDLHTAGMLKAMERGEFGGRPRDPD
jgi:predicted nucleotidyltransferase